MWQRVITDVMDRKKAPELFQLRFRVLLLQLAEEEGGNVAAAGRRVGLQQPHAKALVDGDRWASMPTVEAARKRLRLKQTYFFDERLGSKPKYKEHLERSDRDPLDDAGASILLELQDSEELSASERARTSSLLRLMAAHGGGDRDTVLELARIFVRGLRAPSRQGA